MNTHAPSSTRGRARRRRQTSGIGLAAALALAGCSGDTAESDGGASATAALPPPPAVDTILIEGQPQVLPVAVLTAEEDFPLPFRALVPDSPRLSAHVEQLEGMAALDGAARFEWVPADAPAFLRFVVLDSTVTDNSAAGLVRSIATDFGVIGSGGLEYEEVTPPPAHRWADLAYRLRGQARGQPVSGWISMGRSEDRLFYFMALYPAEYGDGLGPRFEYILRNWRWLPSGQPLQR